MEIILIWFQPQDLNHRFIILNIPFIRVRSFLTILQSSVNKTLYIRAGLQQLIKHKWTDSYEPLHFYFFLMFNKLWPWLGGLGGLTFLCYGHTMFFLTNVTNWTSQWPVLQFVSYFCFWFCENNDSLHVIFLLLIWLIRSPYTCPCCPVWTQRGV